MVENSLHITLPVEWYRNGCVGGTGSALASTISLIGTPAMSGKCWCSHVLNVLDLLKFKSHLCKCCRLATVAGNGNWVGLDGGVWRQGQLRGELRALSGVGGMAAGVVRCDPSGSSSSAIALLRCSVSPTVGKFSEIIPNAVQASRLRNNLSASLVT